tara:strand:- start:478 stop:1158 length:681 start_codon:yes stop_codon:yes gene_type:complete
MKKIFITVLILIVGTIKTSFSEDIVNLNYIEMEVLRNGDVIGFSNYKFSKENGFLKVENETKFKVEVLGVNIFKINSLGTEIYKNNNLVSFESETFQNKKVKYVNLKLSEDKTQYLINGSSYKGNATLDNVIGNWWNYKILQTDTQISPLSGSIKKQQVKYIGDEVLEILGRKINANKFSLKSKNQNIAEDKKLDFIVWMDPSTNIILKVSYERMGSWEYKLKKFN